MNCGCVFWEFVKRKLATQKEKIIKSLPLVLSVSREERCEVLACFHIVVKMHRYSLEERVFIVKTYWITGSIKNCQRMFVEHFGGKQAPRISPHD
jgi:RNase P/RNase MRP subunit POP5